MNEAGREGANPGWSAARSVIDQAPAIHYIGPAQFGADLELHARPAEGGPDIFVGELHDMARQRARLQGVLQRFGDQALGVGF
ncbi:hypothetical protein D9M71_834770 [compost metagenome]